MALVLTIHRKGAESKRLVLAAGEVLTVERDGTPDADFTVTAPAAGVTEVTVTIQVHNEE